jgi:hypothetical protein
VLIRERPVSKSNITSVTYKAMITVKPIEDTLFETTAKILSVSRKGSHHQLIVGQRYEKTIYIYNTTDYSLVKTLGLPTGDNDTLRDAIWTPDGHIVYTTSLTNTISSEPNRVVTMSQSGDVIAVTSMASAEQLSSSTNDVMYLADKIKGVYQSSDKGLTWSLCLI